MKRRSLLAACGLVVLIPHSAQALSDEERDACTLLLTGPKENQVRACASAALRVKLGLTAMAMANASDSAVEESMLTNATTDGDKAARRREIDLALWRRQQRRAWDRQQAMDCRTAPQVLIRPLCRAQVGYAMELAWWREPDMMEMLLGKRRYQ